MADVPGTALEEFRADILEEAEEVVEEAVEDAAKDVKKDLQKQLGRQIEHLEEDVTARVTERVRDQTMEDFADNVDEEADSDPGSTRIGSFGIFLGFLKRLILPLLVFLRILGVTAALLVIYTATGFIRGALWLIALRWILLLGIIGWFGTAAFVANYTSIADAARPIFQVIDDILLRLLAPFINDFLEQIWEKSCDFYNFLVEYFWCGLRILIRFFEIVIISQTTIDQAFFDDNVYGLEWADFTTVNDRDFLFRSDSDSYIRTISLLQQKQLDYEDMLEENTTHADIFATYFGSYDSPMVYSSKIGVPSTTGYWSEISLPRALPRDFALNHMPKGTFVNEEEKPSERVQSELRYEAQFLTESLLGFQFGWDPEADFPRVNLTQLGVDQSDDIYVLTVTVIDDVTDAIGAGIEWFLTLLKTYTIEFALDFFLDLICGDDQDCEITKSAKQGHIHVRDELDDIIADIDAGLFSGIADLFEFFFLDDGVLAGLFVDSYEFLYTEIIRRIFQTVINILFQIPCLNFDSIGCFLASLLDCILIIDLEVCLECHDACDLGCAEDDTCPTTDCLPFVGTCCEDDDPAVLECVENECRSNLDGLITIFECFGRLFIQIIAAFICPLMDAIFVLFGAIDAVFDEIIDAFEFLDTILFDIEDFLVSIGNACDDLLDFDIDFSDTVIDFGIDIDLDFDVIPPSDDDDGTFCDLWDMIDLDINAVIGPITSTFDLFLGLIDDFEGEVDDFCAEFGGLTGNLCEALGLPASICDDLRDEPNNATARTALEKAIRKRQATKFNHRQGFTRAYNLDNYNEIEWMAQYMDDEAPPDKQMSNKEDEWIWKEREREYKDGIEHPIARWYYRLTDEKDRRVRPTKEDYKKRIMDQIRRDKISHLFYTTQKPWGMSQGEYVNHQMKKHNKLIRKLFDKTFVIDPKATTTRLQFSTPRYKWDDDAEYAHSFRAIQGNLTALLMHGIAMFGRIGWSQDEATFKYPVREEILGHLELMGTPQYVAGLFTSIRSYLDSYTEPNLLDLDRLTRIEAQRHTQFSSATMPSEKAREELLKHGPNPYKGAPSVRHRHLYMPQKEKEEFRALAKRYRWHRDTAAVHIAAHFKTFALITYTSLMAPHLVDPVVNVLAARGPAFDAPLTKYLRHFGLTRHMHNITEKARQWRVRKMHEEELSRQEVSGIVNPNSVKARAVDSLYPYDKVYTGADFAADYDQGKRMVRGEKVDLDAVVLSRHADGTPNRVRSNALAKEMTPAKIDEIHRVLPFTMELKHPQFKPMSRRETLARYIKVQERIDVVGTVFNVVVSLVKTIAENPQIFLAVVYPVAISPLGQATTGLWSRFGLRQFEKIFRGYLDFSLTEIENVVLDASETLVYNIIFAFNFGVYIIMPHVLNALLSVLIIGPVWVLTMIVFMIYPPIVFITYPLVAAAFALWIGLAGYITFIGSIPPPPNVDSDGIPTQGPLIGYLHDLIFCNATKPTCTTSEDCAGGAFCDCPEDGLFEYRNFLFTIENTDPCDTPGSGTCLCWPAFKCKARVPIISLATIFTPDCEDQYGYDFRGQVWYADQGNVLQRAFQIVRSSITNLRVQTKFVVRSFLVGWLGFIDRGTFSFIAVAMSLFILVMVRRPIWWFAVTIVTIGLFYFPDTPGEFYIEFILPELERIATNDFLIVRWLRIDELFQGIIDFTRFPNFSPSNVLGLPDIAGGEVTCFIIGLFSGFPGFLSLLVFFVALLMTFATGAFWLLVTLVLQFLWMILLLIWAFLWYFIQITLRRILFTRLRNYVTATATNKRLRGLAERMRNSGSTISLASTSRRSMNYWIPMPPPSKSKMHRTMKEERVKTRRERREMFQQLREMQQEIRALQRGQYHAGAPYSSEHEGTLPGVPIISRDDGEGVYPSAGAITPRATTSRRKSSEHEERGDVERGTGVGTTTQKTLSRAAQGFLDLWNTLRPGTEEEQDKKLE